MDVSALSDVLAEVPEEFARAQRAARRELVEAYAGEPPEAVAEELEDGLVRHLKERHDVAGSDLMRIRSSIPSDPDEARNSLLNAAAAVAVVEEHHPAD